MNCNLLLPDQSDENKKAPVRQKHKKADKACVSRIDASKNSLSNHQLPQQLSMHQRMSKPQVRTRRVQFADPLEGSSSSDDEVVVVASSERGERDSVLLQMLRNFQRLMMMIWMPRYHMRRKKLKVLLMQILSQRILM